MILPRVVRTSKYAHRGTVLHAYVGAALTSGRDVALRAVPEEYRETCEGVDLVALKQLLGGHPKVEEAFVFDIREEAVRYIGSNIGRHYGPLLDTEIAGTVDLLHVTDDAVCIADLKTGWQYVGPASDSWQMKTLALVAARYFGKSKVHATLVRMREDGSLYQPPTATFTAFELDSFLDELRDLYLRIDTVSRQPIPDVYPGEKQCQYCDCLEHCPAYTGLMHSMKFGLETTEAVLLTEKAPIAWDAIKRWRKALDRVEAGIRMLSTREPIALLNGKTLGKVLDIEKSINAVKARPVLVELLKEHVDEAAKPSVTQASIKRAVKLAAPAMGMTQKALFDRAMKALEVAGAIEFEQSEVVKEVDVWDEDAA